MEIKVWDDLTDGQLQQAVLLMVRPEWLKERRVSIAILEALDYDAKDAAEVIASGQPLHDGIPAGGIQPGDKNNLQN
jgi:hypothetical protein